jgi:hypothetical protein
VSGGSSFDETQHVPHTTYGVGEEAYYGAYGEATWQQQQQQDDELAEGDAFSVEQTSGLGSFRSPSVGSESFDDDEDELEMPSTQGNDAVLAAPESAPAQLTFRIFIPPFFCFLFFFRCGGGARVW